MRLTTVELICVGLLIVYVAFFTHPPPGFIKTVLSSPVGHAVALLVLLYVTVYQSLITGVFLAIAYLTTASSVTEYLDPKDQKPKKQESKPSSGAPAPNASGILKSMLGNHGVAKGDTLAHHAKAGKSETAPPPSTNTVKPNTQIKTEHFSLF